MIVYLYLSYANSILALNKIYNDLSKINELWAIFNKIVFEFELITIIMNLYHLRAVWAEPLVAPTPALPCFVCL